MSNQDEVTAAIGDVLEALGAPSKERALALLHEAYPSWDDEVLESWSSGDLEGSAAFRELRNIRNTITDSMAEAFAHHHHVEPTDDLKLLMKCGSMLETCLRMYFSESESSFASSDKKRFVMNGTMLMSVGIEMQPIDNTAWWQPNVGDWSMWYDFVISYAQSPHDFDAMQRYENIRKTMDILHKKIASESK